MSSHLAETLTPKAPRMSYTQLPTTPEIIRRNARELRLKQIKLLTQGEAVEFLLAQIEELEAKLAAGQPPKEHFYKGLTKTEEELLDMLLRNRGRVCSKEVLLDLLYQLRTGDAKPEPKIIDIFICKLRKKLKENSGPEILTLWGRGYYIASELRETFK